MRFPNHLSAGAQGGLDRWSGIAYVRPLPVAIGSVTASFGLSLFLILFTNGAFWGNLAGIVKGFSLANMALFFSVFVALTALLTLFISLLTFRYIFKPVAIVLLLSAAAAAYYMDAYGVMFDRKMIYNILQTDVDEARELISAGLLYHLLLLGVLPSLALAKVEIRYDSLLGELQKKVALAFLCLVIAAGAIFPFFKEYAAVGRNNGYLRYLINPTSYIGALWSTWKHSRHTGPVVVVPVGLDAHQAAGPDQAGKKNLLLLVVGETARAGQWALNGYDRPTNPALGGEQIINYDNVYSCGTATAVSLPCMFSPFGRSDYSKDKAERTENLLDVLRHAGINVLWRENNSGCKGVCKRVTTEVMRHLQVEELCTADQCYDEILLHNLQGYLAGLTGDAVIVLHQKGSHGPAYFRRHPASFTAFRPECTKPELQECSRQEIVNAYDNTILYTDYFLGRTIDFLRRHAEEFNSAMIYVSDHGESLGENNLYLHGLPYLIAPDEQRHVPLVVWLSEGMRRQRGIDGDCLRRQGSSPYSHDNLFHSVLGLMGVEAEVYDAGQDIFAGCGQGV